MDKNKYAKLLSDCVESFKEFDITSQRGNTMILANESKKSRPNLDKIHRFVFSILIIDDNIIRMELNDTYKEFKKNIEELVKKKYPDADNITFE